MDDTQQSRVSDAAATRKRRSSILKVQRPPRAPFSELEFNVATPTDTAKSRRVSFSRRTGVAEFATNEATTTWKNFYEEHNKSLESSGNESGAKPPRPSVGHIGNKHIFDQQFQDVEASDFISLHNGRPCSSEVSLNNINYAELECTDRNIEPPEKNYEMSMFTDHHSNVFGNDLAVSVCGEMSDRISVNFSSAQNIDINDDLDAIERDLENAQFQGPTVVGPVGFSNGKDMSEYIEFDLNTTHVAVSNDQSDMSITDTIHSPKVQAITTSNASGTKSSLNTDWIADKENIAVNPYITPKESDKFAINEEPEKVLVFDGKRLTIQPVEKTNESYIQSSKSYSVATKSQRKNIVLNVNDDLPNFVEDPYASMSHKSMGWDSRKNLSLNKSSGIENVDNENIVLSDEDIGNISMSQCATGNIINRVSVTEAVTKNVLLNHEPTSDRRKTVVFEDDDGNLSITQAVSKNVLLSDGSVSSNKKQVIVFKTDTGDISLTQVVLDHHANEKQNERNNKMFENQITVTEKDIIANNMVSPVEFDIMTKENVCDEDIKIKKDKRKTIVYAADEGDISLTQAIPSNVILSSNKDKRRTIVFEEDAADISVTQAIPTNILTKESDEKQRASAFTEDAANMSVTQAIPSNILPGTKVYEKRRTIVFEADNNDISMTQAIPTNAIFLEDKPANTDKRKTILFDASTADISVTPALLSNVIMEEIKKGNNERRTMIFENCTGDISMTQAIPSNILSHVEQKEDKRKTIVFDDNNDISFTQAVPASIMSELPSNNEKRKTIIFNDADISMTEAISSNALENLNAEKIKPVAHTCHKSASTSEEAKMAITTWLKSRKICKSKDQNCEEDIAAESREFTLTNPLLKDISRRETIERLNDLFNKTDTKSKNPKLPDLESILQTDETDTESVILIPKSSVVVQGRDIEDNRIEEDSDSINTSSSSGKTFSQLLLGPREDTMKTSSFEKTFSQLPLGPPNSDMSMSDANYISSLPKTGEVGTEVMYQVIKDVENDSFANNEELEIEKRVLYFDKVMPSSKPARPIPSDMLMLQNMHDNTKFERSAIDDILNLKSEVSFETPPKKVLVYQAEDDDLNIAKDKETPEPETNFGELAKNESQSKRDVEQETFIRKTLLDNLLDMSNASLEVNQLDKEVTANIDSAISSAKIVAEIEKSNESLFFVTKDGEGVTQTDMAELDSDRPDIAKDSSMMELHVTLDKLRDFNVIRSESPRPSETINYKNVKSIEYKPTAPPMEPTVSNIMNDAKKNKTFKDADSTRELLEMISSFTDKEERENPVETKVSSHSVSVVSGDIRLLTTDIVAKRQSIVLSREDFINNISMAQAVLQKSRVDNSDSISPNSSQVETEDKGIQAKKFVRVSHDVVKTLQFDEDTSPNDSLSIDTRSSPIKKITYVDNHPVLDKYKVIPDYFRDVTDDIKDLMKDLVKPMADSMPFDTLIEKNTRRSPSTSSMEIQANLFTSSQIDLPEAQGGMTETYVQSESISQPGAVSTKKEETTSSKLNQPLEQSEEIKTSSKITKKVCIDESETHITEREAPSRPVIIFDPVNPLNNIRFMPIDKCEVHKYEPIKGKTPPPPPLEIEAERESSYGFGSSTDSKDHDNKVSQQYMVTFESKLTNYNLCKSYLDSESTLMSQDRSTEAVVSDLKDTEVNTVIAMRNNKEILELNSSLTLVDHAMLGEMRGVNDEPLKLVDKSPLTLIYKQEQDIPNKTESDAGVMMRKKRLYSPTKSCSVRFMNDTPPKPSMKLQKCSTSPQKLKTVFELHKSSEKHSRRHDHETPTRDKDTPMKDAPRSPTKLHNIAKVKKAGTTIAVHQVVAKYNITERGAGSKTVDCLKGDFNQDGNIGVTSDYYSPKNVDSVTSSKVRCICHNQSICTCDSRLTCMRGQGLAMDWQPELVNDLSSKNLITECDSSVNVVTKIDTLPIMGTRDVEWESASDDCWTFGLLHGRLRLCVALSHQPENSRTYVRADTPLRDIKLHTVNTERENAIALLCVRFAEEAVRYAVFGRDEGGAGGGGRVAAGALPALLRRGAGVARVALRWGRAMRDARAHLAYKLATNGELTLKVANIPLRSVWEVSMRIEMTVDDASEMPWPCATDVSVSPVVADIKVKSSELRPLLDNVRRDWGHAPRTLWKIFKYLKKKTRDDYF